MEISAALRADLQSLTEALDDSRPDLASLVRDLDDGMRLAVRSYLGLRITVVVDGFPFTATVMERGVIGTSLLLPLSTVGTSEQDSMLVFYAVRRGAFVDFAADISFALGLALDAVVLDQHREPADHGTAPSGLADLALVNQAVGILVGGGDSPASAQTQLKGLADLAGSTVVAAAQRLIHTTVGRDGTELA